MQDLEKEVFGGDDDKLTLFVIGLWEYFVRWAQGLLTASAVLHRQYNNDDTAQVVVDAQGTAYAITFGSKTFQKKLGEDTSAGFMYEQLFSFQETMFPALEHWYGKFGEYGIYAVTTNEKTGETVPLHEEVKTHIAGFLSKHK